MLITSLLMSINQLLPVVILLVLLQSLLKLNQRVLIVTAFVGLLCSIIYVQSAAWLSQLFAHRGLEFSQMLLCVIVYVASLVSCKQRRLFALLAIVAVMALYLSHYFIYLVGFWHNTDTAKPLLIGTSLGIGICGSFGVLLLFLLHSVRTRFGVYPLMLLLAFNVSAKLLIVLDLASQIDLINITSNYFDWRAVLVENSELGRVLKALVGYEATPSKTALWLYLVAVLAFIGTSIVFTRQFSQKEPS